MCPEELNLEQQTHSIRDRVAMTVIGMRMAFRELFEDRKDEEYLTGSLRHRGNQEYFKQIHGYYPPNFRRRDE